jgi:hypothetical protein
MGKEIGSEREREREKKNQHSRLYSRGASNLTTIYIGLPA